ncbi:MAG TPA: protein-glutamate O-methyltransferase CheR [Terriglobales bacterium]|nr:protein-glutamate O-methyltransferase CheR [Terriglobales bacterium]
MSIATPEFDYLRKFMREGTAILLDEDKQYLAESRLAPLIHNEGFSSVQALLEQMRTTRCSTLQRKVLDAMTNNETWFFRDLAPFEALRSTILPEIICRRSNERKLAIWSAACSSGQEPYSLAMLVLEHFPELCSWDFELTATDISLAILERAQRGRYTQLEVNRGLPARLLTKYFTQQGAEWQVADRVRRLVRFRNVNLAEPWPDLRKPDIVLLRNVLIYFGIDTKRQILDRVARHMCRDGYLFLGCAETTLNLSDSFERTPIGSSFCYRLKSY